MSFEISSQLTDSFAYQVKNEPQSKNLMQAVGNNGIYQVAENPDSIRAMRPTFSIDLETGEVANQRQSGRCWMFAALNTMRHDMQNRYNLDKFELSQNYTFFWDKFEKSNYFYENVINTANEDSGSRRFDFLMTTPQQDGGQWDMLCAIIEKYGIVPAEIMPDNANATNSRSLNQTLNTKLRHDAVVLRNAIHSGKTAAEVESMRQLMLQDIYRLLVFALGPVPSEFDWEYLDKDKKYHREAGLTPKTFYDKFIGWNLSDYISIINAPTEDKPYNQLYTVDLLGNIVGGREVRHLNLEMDRVKELVIAQLKDGEGVWFGSDVGKSSDRQKGIMDPDLYTLDTLFSTDFSMSKAERLDYDESLMTHAMVITGVDLVDDKPTKWKVENSWGDKPGAKGYFVMSDEWMSEFVYQAVINKKYLTSDEQYVYDSQYSNPTILKPWDPMGALA
ncbi:C1 family peptidase [Xylocopilactobacillus apicola]|uniref:Aminopeptidase n=1 Tax=Xylocopilactobacillus apicola TaxID=2932184 RepID=A0AAU9D7R7_9LACO|nr:C1 family peptidase [Xylocopilactobacillus apicola]BDR59593.1 aminopeptidase C [Xylocopilactobacillus apicola]